MSRMAVKPNDKKSLKSFSGMKGPMSLGQGVQHWGHRDIGPINFEKNDKLGLTLNFYGNIKCFS